MTYELTKNKYLLDHEIEHLEETLKKFAASDPRNVALIYTALLTGGRATEILRLRPQDLETKEGTVFIRGIKNSDNREIPIPKWLVKMLQAQIKPGEEFIFPISYIRFSQIWGLYRPVKKKLHSLRHTFAIRLYKKCKDIRLIQYTLGHKSFKNTIIYMKYEYSNTELKKAIL